MSSARWLLGLGLAGMVACGPTLDSSEPSEEGSTGSQPEGSDDEDATETDTGTADEGVDESTGSTGEVLEGWCLESRTLVELPQGSPSLLTHADVDADGLPELWLSEHREDDVPLYHAVGLADGEFGEITTHDVDRRIHALVDVDGDGHTDALSLPTQPEEPAGWFAGRADGAFSARLRPLVDPIGSWAHLNGDPVADRIRSPEWGSYVVERGVGDGTFVQVGPLALAESGDAVVVPVRDMPGRFGIRASDGGIGFPSYITQVYGFDDEGDLWLTNAAEWGIPEPWSLFDVDEDGVVDMVYFDSTSGDSGLVLGRGQLDGTFVHEVLMPVDGGVLDGSAGDFDGDGRLDLLWTSNADDSVWLAHGIDGGFESPVVVEATVDVWRRAAIEPVDYDGDGRDRWITQRVGGLDAHELVRCPL